MVKEVRYMQMQSWGEVAPNLLISYRKYYSFPKLETIDEELGTENSFEFLPKRVVLFLLPVLFSLFSYYLLYRHLVV
ncbi:hypothetical protein I3843_10G086400 [Carya illinoinensis]|uniref:Uncharacterized protein n=1 Tax=Carya illinoinensis TaxID=32201 RepID=A0A922A587_CARIL|nr:hypothetical protein I3760_10G088400 [Carya illinoinensis]KAG6620633.1 hypothetical protein I3842_Q057800 [Carya illinoinensis]KAG6691983.1 hypothetical protein I3842_10G088700 [Carya illinoinensis]KAG7959793.1 hypothetical protein I3843_10G086400 [Carya illinoinensis]